MSFRRIAAVVLPQLLCELAERTEPTVTKPGAPLAVIVNTANDVSDRIASNEKTEPLDRSAIVAAVSKSAHSLGVRPGQKLSEAHAHAAHLEVVSLPLVQIQRALHAIAEVAMAFSPTVQIVPMDAVWIDVTGVAHLFGGEEALVEAIEARIKTLGYQARVGLADGPRIAEALARYSHDINIAPQGRSAEALAPLPLVALSLPDSLHSLFARLAVLTVGDFCKLPKGQVAARLEGRGQDALLLAHGFDVTKLVPQVTPDTLLEVVEFEDGTNDKTQLLFAASQMTSLLSKRLRGRGQATCHMEAMVIYDRKIFALHRGEQESTGQVPSAQEGQVVASTDFPAPLSRHDDLFRTVKAKLDHLVLVAPAKELRLTLSRLVVAPQMQLDLSRDVAISPDALPALLSELVADLGAACVGILLEQDEILPERRSRLMAIDSSPPQTSGSLDPEPVLLFEPIPFSLMNELRDGHVSPRLRAGVPRREQSAWLGSEAFLVEDILFDRRLDATYWWTGKTVARDYFRVLLKQRRAHRAIEEAFLGSAFVGGEAWVFVDRASGESFLHGFWE